MGCKFYFGAEKKEKEGNEMKKEKKLQRIGTHRDGKNGGGGWKKRFYRARTEEDCTTGLFLGKSSRQSATKLARMCRR